MARKQSKRTSSAKMTETQRLAQKLGVAESTIRSRRSRGQKLNAKPQVRLTDAQQRKVARARGTTAEVAEKYGVSVSTVKRLRRELSV